MSTEAETGAEDPSSVGWTEAKTVSLATEETPFALEAGGAIGPVQVEYETYGEMNADKSNVILIEHALSGDAHVAGWDKHAVSTGRQWRTRKPGWWDAVVGPGKAIDTNRFFVICSNVLGSCYGTTGPSSINPQTAEPYGLSFPIVTVPDWVNLQVRLLDALGIDRLYAVIGGSLGGQQSLEWALAYPERVEKVIILASAARLSAQGLAFNAVGRFSIIHDQHFLGGNYYGHSESLTGLAAARMLAHITYLSDEGMHRKFGRRLQDKDAPDFGFGTEFQVESYLQYQGASFVERFDANSYLYITRAMDYYDAAERWGDGDIVEACRRIQSEVMVVSFSTDWLYPPMECREFAYGICQAGKSVSYIEVPSPFGHDAFLVETDRVGTLLESFLRTKRKA